MTAIVTNDLRYAKLRAFIASLYTVPLYIGIGKTYPWNNDDEIGADDSNPATPSISEHGLDYSELVTLKRILVDNTSIVVPRVNWNNWTGIAVDTKYSYWGELDGSGNPATEPNYVLTQDYRVYKCIYRVGNAVSTIKPAQTVNTEFTLADGYTWKYLYTITPSEAIKYLSEDWMPVKYVTAQSEEATGSGQWTVQNNTIPGTVNAIEIIDGGAGYDAGTYNLVGDGFNATVDITVDGSGIVTGITVTNKGSNYNWARLPDSFLSTGLGLEYKVNISPVLGHGSYPQQELNGKYLLIRSTLVFNEGSGDLITKNDYRKILLLAQPLEYLGSPALLSTYDCTTKFVFGSSVSNILADDVVTNVSGASAKVVEVDSAENKLKVSNISGTFAVNDVLTFKTNGGNNRTLTLSSIVNPEIKPATGSIIYKDYRRPIMRSSEQREVIDIVLEF